MEGGAPVGEVLDGMLLDGMLLGCDPVVAVPAGPWLAKMGGGSRGATGAMTQADSSEADSATQTPAADRRPRCRAGKPFAGWVERSTDLPDKLHDKR